MAMTEHSRKAFDELTAMGVPLIEWDDATENDPGNTYTGCAFLIVWANDDNSEIFADFRGGYLKGGRGDKCVGAVGIRRDIARVLAKYRLATDWATEGQVLVYNDHDGPGYAHGIHDDDD